MTKLDFDLTKKRLEFCLEKRKIAHIKGVRVCFIGDVSGSMSELWKNGFMQERLNDFFCVANRMDDDGSMESCVFSNHCYDLPDITEHNYENYVNKSILNNYEIQWGGTVYSPALQYMLEKMFPPSKPGFIGRLFGAKAKNMETVKKVPTYMIFQTDGECFPYDHKKTEDVIKKLGNEPAYIQFLAFKSDVNTNFEFIQMLADKYNHVGITIVDDVLGLSTDALYENMITDETAEWFRSVCPENKKG